MLKNSVRKQRRTSATSNLSGASGSWEDECASLRGDGREKTTKSGVAYPQDHGGCNIRAATNELIERDTDNLAHAGWLLPPA